MTDSRLRGVDPRVASDADVAGPLWAWPVLMIPAVKSERRKRFKIDHDDEGLPAVLDE